MPSNDSALVYAYILDGNGGARTIDWNEVNNWQPDQGTLWIHLNYELEESRIWLEHKSGLDPMVSASLLAGETRPRCATLADGVLVNLRGVNTNPGSEAEDMVSIRVFSDGKRIISTRRRKLLSVTDIAGSLMKNEGPRSAGQLLAALTSRLTDRMGSVVSNLDDEIDAVEEDIVEPENLTPRHKVIDLRRQIIMLRRYLAPQREALARLQIEKAEWLSESDRLGIREATDRLSRYVEDLDSCRDRAAVANEELVSRLSEQMNSRMYVLSIVAAIFLPLGFLTGLFGINVGGIPLAENHSGFLLVSLIMLALVILQIIIFRMKRWF